MEQLLLSRIQALLGTKNRVNGAANVDLDGASTSSDELDISSFHFGSEDLSHIEQLVDRARQQLSDVRIAEISHSYEDLLRTKATAVEADAEKRSTNWQYHDLATTLDELADFLKQHGQFVLAVSVYQRALDLRTSAVVAGPVSPLFSEAVDWRVERAASYFKIAKALKLAGQSDAAATAQQKGQAMIEQTAGTDQDAFALETFADQLEETALTAIDSGDNAGAAHCLKESLDLRLRAAESEPEDPYFAKRFIECATEYSEKLVGRDWRAKALDLVDRRALSGRPISGAEQILARDGVMGA